MASTWTGDPYWSADTFLFSGRFRYYRGEVRQIRGLVHLSEETFTPDMLLDAAPLPLSAQGGKRVYLMISPYVVERSLVSRLARYGDERSGEEENQATPSGERPTPAVAFSPCGDIQGWYYAADTALFLWEGLLEPSLRDSPLPDDANTLALWRGIERWVLEQFPGASQILTPRQHPFTPTDQYHAFLSKLGYARVAPATWGKRIESTPPGA
jgi:hypothetical protein